MQEIILNAPSMRAVIQIGKDVARENLKAKEFETRKKFVLTDKTVFTLHRDFFEECFPNTPIYVMKSGEKYKTFTTLEKILSAMVQAGLHRSSVLFAVGGGVVGDVGGFAAATYMRGIECIQIPTTLLAQVDSSVGGKTAVDLAGVKNVVGAFYQPSRVWIDPTFLHTLPDREIKCGVGEIVKYAALNGKIYDLLNENKTALTRLDFLETLIYECVKHKAGVVERDEKENGERRSLNVGHTTGHAIELKFGLSHGESVLYGMALETRMAIDNGLCEKEYGEKLLSLVLSAIELAPCGKFDKRVSRVKDYAVKAKADKKNADDGKIKCAVAKSYGEWTMMETPYDEYVSALESATSKLFD